NIARREHVVSASECSRFRGTGDYGTLRPRPNYCGLIPANLITLAHFSVSSAIILASSAGDAVSGSPPRSARRAFILGSWRAALPSLLSFSTISAGVAFGAPTPNQPLAS